MPLTSSAYDLELQLEDGSWLGLMLVKPEGWKMGDPIVLADSLSALASDSPISQDLQASTVEDWISGVGVGYDGAYSVYTRTPGFACPAGQVTNVPLPVTGNASNSPLVAFAEYGGSLYIAQRGQDAGIGGRVLKLTPSGGTMGAPTEVATTAAGDVLRDLLVADDGFGKTVLFASSESPTHTNARLHKLDGATWTHTTAGTEFAATRGLGRLAYVYWKTEDGNGDWRLVAITGSKTIAYTFPQVDPMVGTTVWSPDVKLGTQTDLAEMAAFRKHVFFLGDDLYDVNELGESQAMTSYLRKMLLPGINTACEHLSGYVYVSAGRGLIRIYVGNPGVLDESPIEGQCAPGWGTPAEGPFRGYVTAMTTDQGYLVCAVYNPTNQRSYLFWGVDKRVVGVQSPNSMIWYGPECVSAATWQVTRLWTSNLAGDLRLWIASRQDVTLAPRLDWLSLPVAGSPIQDLVSVGTHRFTGGANPLDAWQQTSELVMLADSGDDKAAAKIVYQFSVGSRGLDKPGDPPSGTKLTLYARADPDPKDTRSWTPQGDVTLDPVTDLVPVAPVVQGHKLQTKVAFVSPHGADASPSTVQPAVLDSLRTLVWRIAPSLRVLTLDVEYGAGVLSNQMMFDSERAPDDVTKKLKRVTESDRTTLRDRQDHAWTVKLRQVLDGAETMVDDGSTPWGKRVRKRLQLTILDGPLT